MDDVISLTDVEYAVQGRVILRGITLDLHERRIGIVGRNGSGKTTLLRVIAGLIAPTAGQMRIGGLDPAVDRRGVLSRLGILFQSPDHQIIFPLVEEELAFGLRQMGVARPEAERRVRSLLQAEGRGGWIGRPVQGLSLGQKQWLCLQAVLLMAPGTLLLDEPFAALDLPAQIRLARRIADLPQRIITISHDPGAVADCDRVIWIETGQIRGDGAAASVLAEFRAEMARLGAEDADTDL